MQKLIGSEVALGDIFGTPIAISRNTMVIGAWRDDDNGGNSGAVYVYHFDVGTGQWFEVQKLVPADGQPFDRFGQAVATNRDTIFVGADDDDPDDCSELPCDSGSVYVFRLDQEASQWIEVQKLVSDDIGLMDHFGTAIGAGDDFVVISSLLDDDNGADSGAAYVFRYDGEQWVQEQKLTAEDGEAGDGFGSDVAVSGNTAVIGAWADDDAGTNAGAAYIFEYDGESWIERQKLLASDGSSSDGLGRALAIDDNLILLGVNSDDPHGSHSGSAYVFRHDGVRWIEEQKLVPSDGAEFQEFGYSVAFSGDIAIVGSNLDDDIGASSGSAYVYRCIGGSWVESEKLHASDGHEAHFFGGSIGFVNDMAVIGASGDDDHGFQAGAAYVFAGLARADCNMNGASDACEIFDGSTQDSNGDGVPDECDCPGDLDASRKVDIFDFFVFWSQWGPCAGCSGDIDGNDDVGVTDLLTLLANWGPCPFFVDCNGNGIFDPIDLQDGTSLDCNGNGVPDGCDLVELVSQDCNANGIPDECDQDCNGNGLDDGCDIADGTSLDADGNGVPDECEPPPNDDCENATPISDGATPFITINATIGGEGDEFTDCGTFFHDVWFAYTPRCTGIATFSICDDADFDALLAVHPPGCPAGFNTLACSDDAADCGANGPVQLLVAEGIPYLVRIGGAREGADGSGVLTVFCEP